MNLPDAPLSHDRARLLDHSMESPIEAHHRHHPRTRGRIENAAPLVRVRREWFLEVEVLAGSAGGKGKIMMEICRSTNDDGIDIVSCEEIFGVLEDRLL